MRLSRIALFCRYALPRIWTGSQQPSLANLNVTRRAALAIELSALNLSGRVVVLKSIPQAGGNPWSGVNLRQPRFRAREGNGDNPLKGRKRVRKRTRQPELRKFLSNPARTGSCYTKPEAAAMQSRNPLSSGWPVFPDTPPRRHSSQTRKAAVQVQPIMAACKTSSSFLAHAKSRLLM